MRTCGIAVAAIAMMAAAAGSIGAQSVLGRNLIVNGDAESGPGTDATGAPVTSIPGWSIANGTPDVLLYGKDDTFAVDSIGPANRGGKYFTGGPANAFSAIGQDIDVSSGSAAIDAGTATFAASAYLGGLAHQTDSAKLVVTFLSATGGTLGSVALGPVASTDDLYYDGLQFRREIGFVPASTRKIHVSLEMTRSDSNDDYNEGSADNLSLVLNTPGAAQSVLGANLIANPGAEAGPNAEATASEAIALDLPSWSRTGYFSTEAYEPDGDVLLFSSPGPADRGVSYFTGGPSNAGSTAYQYIDVSAAASLIDSGKVTYAASAWLGGFDAQEDHVVETITFLGASHVVLGTAAQLGPVTAEERNNIASLYQRSTNGTVPAGTRFIKVLLTMTRTDGNYDDGYADNLSLVLNSTAASGPTIAQGGVITASGFGGFTSISPGTYIEIYGSNLATSNRTWGGSDFQGFNAPTSLDGVGVTVGGQKAFVYFVNPGQLDVLVPDNISPGTAQVVVTNGGVSSNSYSVNVNALAPGFLAPPSFVVNGKQYIVALFPDGVTYVAPTGAIPGVNSRPAKPGETILLYGVGFGPVNPSIPAGQIVQTANSLRNPLELKIGGAVASQQYAGLAPGFVGLYQFNIVVPQVAANPASAVTFTVGASPGTQTLYIAVGQ